MDASTDSGDTRRWRRLVRFNLTWFLLRTMLAASYCAGWVSHRSWNRRNVERATAEAMEALQKMSAQEVRVEYVDEGDVLIPSGRKEDIVKIEEVVSKISAIEEAVQQ